MPLSEEEKKERHRAACRAYYQRNKEHIIARVSAYYQTHKEEQREANRRWIERNKEQKAEYDKQYNQTPEGIKRRRIDRWKRSGVICDNWDELYNTYLSHKNCEDCGCEFGDFGDGTGTFRCLDHDHETGAFRAIVCNSCNIRRGIADRAKNKI
jgi:hypothetical protein